MADQVEIINLALRRIGEDTIQNIDEKSAAANLMTDVYERMRLLLLRSFPWQFATTTAALAVLSEQPPDFTNAFTLPDDYVQIVTILDTAGLATGDTVIRDRDMAFVRPSDSEWEVREAKLYANFDELTIKYVRNVTDEEKFDDAFVDCFAWKLAAEAAVFITKDAAIADRADQQFLAAYSNARLSSAVQTRRTLKIGREYVKSRLR